MNFGWRPYEGRERFADEPAPGAVFPVIQKSHDDGWCSITGGYIVRDPALPALRGRYVYGDFCLGQLRSARLAVGQGDAATGRWRCRAWRTSPRSARTRAGASTWCRSAGRSTGSRRSRTTLRGMWPVIITAVIIIPLLVLAWLRVRRR